MRIGFTGTRKGMTPLQRSSLAAHLKHLQNDSLAFAVHTGCCLGADEQFVELCAEVFRCCVRIVGHPGDWGPLVSQAACARSNVLLPCKPHLERNRDIVAESECLIAAPEAAETLRSGTWSTVRHARRLRMPITIVWPDGNVTKE